MIFEGDIYQIRLKNSSFGNPKFSIGVHLTHFILFFFEKACQNAGHDKVLVMWKKRVTSSTFQKPL